MDLLLVPAVLAAGAAGFAWLMDKRQHEAEEQRVQTEREVALDRSRAEALQTYLDRMTDLIGDGLGESELEHMHSAAP